MEDIFEIATREKLKFDSDKGDLDVEQVWDLPVETLDEMYWKYESTLEKTERTLLQTRKTSKTIKEKRVRIKMAILEHIISVKEDEAKKAKESRIIKALRDKLIGIKAEKQDEIYRNMTPEQLDEELSKLDS